VSQFKYTTTLKQHTPIIHFQANQSGATLRATELKPKFDKFLLKYYRNEVEKFKIKDKEALDYKVKIKAFDVRIANPDRFLFFANGLIDNPLSTTFSKKIEVEFFSFKTELVELIKNYFKDFLLITNFGSRNNKGYGSFTDNKDNLSDLEERLKNYNPILFRLTTNSRKWEQDVLNTHNKMKAGINFPHKNYYFKSLLFRYMCNTYNIRWEKRKIKQEFPEVVKRGHQPAIDCEIPAQFRYVRAMLGVAELYEFNQATDRVEISSNEIKRFPTPIVYKVINNSIYLLGNESYQQIMGKNFTFSYNGNDFSLQTPLENEFNLLEFLRFCQTEENLISEVV